MRAARANAIRLAGAAAAVAIGFALLGLGDSEAPPEAPALSEQEAAVAAPSRAPRDGARRVAASQPGKAGRGRDEDGILPLMPSVVPGEIVEDPDPIANEYAMMPLVNAWRVGSHTEYTWVYAGGAGIDDATGEPSADGRLIITRERYSRNRPLATSAEQVDVVGSGPLRIVDAPRGQSVTRSAHSEGQVAFSSASGISGVLDLGQATVSLGVEP